MATATKTTPTERVVVNNEPEVNALDSLQFQYEKNKKTINTAATVILLAVAGFFAWRFYNSSRNEKAATAVSYAQRYFESDSASKALNGDGQHSGFLKVMKKFSGTKTANLCHYYAGVCYIKLGDYKNAIKQLEDFDGEGTPVGMAAKGALGDAYMETGKMKDAIEAYEDAAADKDNIALTPMFLYRAGLAYEADKQPKKAADAYRRVRDEFPTSPQARDMDKYLARLGELE
jgi:TolA-binding protein